MREVLVNRLFKVAMEKVWLGDHDMTIAVDLDVKKNQIKTPYFFLSVSGEKFVYRNDEKTLVEFDCAYNSTTVIMDNSTFVRYFCGITLQTF